MEINSVTKNSWKLMREHGDIQKILNSNPHLNRAKILSCLRGWGDTETLRAVTSFYELRNQEQSELLNDAALY